MKKTLLGILTTLSLSAFGQADVSVTLNSPSANDNLQAGVQFTCDMTVTNTGSVNITTSDSIIYGIRVGGQFIAGLVFFDASGLAPAASETYSFPVNITGGSTGMLEMCANAIVIGPNWNGVTESDTTNNLDCVMVNWDATVGINEFALAKAGDNSFYSEQIYHVRLENQNFVETPKLVVYSITGAQVFTTNLSGSSNYGQVSEDVSLPALPKGVYLVQIQGTSTHMNARRIVVQ